MKEQQKPAEPKPEEVKAPETWTQTTRDPKTGELMTEEKDNAKTH